MNSTAFDEDEFNKKALELFNMSEVLNDNWQINEKSGKFYLRKKQNISVKLKPVLCDEDGDKSTLHNVTSEVISIEYHVLFHPSYQIPVLFFNAHSDGSLIRLDEISKVFVADFEFKNSSHDELHNIITQAEHPILFKPFFLLHPCKVNQVLSNFPKSKNFILTFLTIFGPSVQLNMSHEYEKFFAEL